MLITDLLRQNAQQYPGESALVSVDTKNLIPDQPDSYEACRRTLTWKQFDALANRIANYLLHMGIRKGSKVGIMMMNRIEYLPLFFGILRAGAVWEEGKKDMNLKHQKFVKKGCYSACISCKDMLHLT